MRVFVTGGSGYVGQKLIDELLVNGYEINVLLRENSQRKMEDNRLKIVYGDLFSPEALAEGLFGVDAVIHLVGIIREHPRHGVTMQRVHVDGTLAVVEAAERANVSRIIHMSALGARPNAISSYHESKWMAEEIVRQSGLKYTIFRPSVIFGRGGPGPNFIQQLTDLVQSTPLIPIIGDGEFLLQPVSIDTVAEVFVKALRNTNAINQTFEVGGPEILTYREILERISALLDKPFRTVRIPLSLMKLMVPLLQNVPGFPLTADQLTMLKEGNVCTNAEVLYTTFAVNPVAFSVQA